MHATAAIHRPSPLPAPPAPLEQTLAGLLENFDRAALIVNAAGRIRLANDLARAMLHAADGLLAPDGRLQGARERETAALRELVIAAATGTSGGLAAPRRSGARDYIVSARPLTMGMVDGFGSHAAALILVFDPDARRSHDEAGIAALHGLTAAEARIAVRLADGDTVTQAAEATGVSVNTVRFHLRSLFAKTGTHRQAELVALLGQSPSHLKA